MKISIQHSHVTSTDELDSTVEEQIMAFQSLLEIEEAVVRFEHRHEASPPYNVSVRLVTPGPDVCTEGRDHTLRAAIGKAMDKLRTQIDERSEKRLRRVKSNLQEPAHTRTGRGGS